MKAVVRDRHCSERLYRSVCFTSETELLYPVISREPESQILKPELGWHRKLDFYFPISASKLSPGMVGIDPQKSLR